MSWWWVTVCFKVSSKIIKACFWPQDGTTISDLEFL